MFIRYLVFRRLLLFSTCIFLILFRHPYVTAIQMSCSDFVILSLFSNRLSVQLYCQELFYCRRRDFLWHEYDLSLVWPSKCHGHTCLAQFSFVSSRSCQPNYHHDLSRSSLAGWHLFLWPESGPCLTEDFCTGSVHKIGFQLLFSALVYEEFQDEQGQIWKWKPKLS